MQRRDRQSPRCAYPAPREFRRAAQRRTVSGDGAAQAGGHGPSCPASRARFTQIMPAPHITESSGSQAARRQECGAGGAHCPPAAQAVTGTRGPDRRSGPGDTGMPQAPVPHGQRGGPATPPSPEAGSVPLTALQSDLTAANVVLVPDSTPRQRRARAGAREGIARDGRRARFRTGGSKRRPRDCGWQREPRREASHSYQLFTKHQRSPRAPHRFSRDLAFSPIPAAPITTPLVLSIPTVARFRENASETSCFNCAIAHKNPRAHKMAALCTLLPYKKMAALV